MGRAAWAVVVHIGKIPRLEQLVPSQRSAIIPAGEIHLAAIY